jgi:hypothetical protein
MLNCRQCGYLVPESWVTCRRCHAPLGTPVPANGAPALVPATPFAAPATPIPAPATPFAAPASPPLTDDFTTAPLRTHATVSAPPAREWWRDRNVALALTGVGFVCILVSAFALPWMRFGGLAHVNLSYNQTRDALAHKDSFTHFALDLGAFLVLVDLLVIGWRLASTGRIGREAIAAPIGIAVLVLYVADQIRGLAGQFNDLGLPAAFDMHAHVGSGPFVCLLGCALLVAGGVLGPNAN